MARCFATALLAAALLLNSAFLLDAQPTCTSGEQQQWSSTAQTYTNGAEGGTQYAFFLKPSITAGCRLDVSSIGNFQYSTQFAVAQLDRADGTGFSCACPGGGQLVTGIECRSDGSGCNRDWDCAVCVNSAGGNGDPHFRGLDGTSFDFQGVDGHFYNLLTHADVQANFGIVRRGMHFDANRGWYQLPTHKNTSTWIGSAGFKHRGDVVTVDKAEDMTVTALLNGVPLKYNSTVLTASGMTVTWGDKLYKGSPFTAKNFASEGDYVTQHLTVDTPLFVFDVDVLPTFSRRMDIGVGIHQTLAELEHSVDGMVGHTIRTSRPFEGFDMEEIYADVEKVWDDAEREHIRYSATLEAEMGGKFETPALVSDDFPANKYIATPISVTRARKLIQVPAALPVFASTSIVFA